MPADLVIPESELQAFIERTVLAVQNARARLASTSPPLLTDDFEIQFSGVLLLKDGANALERASTTLSGGGLSVSRVTEPAQATITTQEAEESVESTSSATEQAGESKREESAGESSQNKSGTNEEQAENTKTSETTAQAFGRTTEVNTEYNE